MTTGNAAGIDEAYMQLRAEKVREYCIASERYALLGVVPIREWQEPLTKHPCPFCKGVAELVHDEGCGGFVDRRPSYSVKCFSCGSSCGEQFYENGGETEAREKAVALWMSASYKEDE